MRSNLTRPHPEYQTLVSCGNSTSCNAVHSPGFNTVFILCKTKRAQGGEIIKNIQYPPVEREGVYPQWGVEGATVDLATFPSVSPLFFLCLFPFSLPGTVSILRG